MYADVANAHHRLRAQTKYVQLGSTVYLFFEAIVVTAGKWFCEGSLRWEILLRNKPDERKPRDVAVKNPAENFVSLRELYWHPFSYERASIVEFFMCVCESVFWKVYVQCYDRILKESKGQPGRENIICKYCN
jgi:hypothetical protein